MDNNSNMLIYQLIREVRPRQWIKNFFVFGAIIFAKKFFEFDFLLPSIFAFFAFSFMASFVYILNDIVDVEKDRLHPIKKNRPIASGKLGIPSAVIFAFLLLVISLLLAISVSSYLFYVVVAYLLLQTLYSFYLKNLIIVDAISVSIGFILRVLAGGIASHVSISSWLILSVIGLSLLMAFGKRRAEKTILQSRNLKLETRQTLKHYPDSLLDAMVTSSASFAIITYSLFTFFTSPANKTPEILAIFLPGTISAPKWMMVTIPIFLYSVARYLYVIYENKNAESPERALLGDRPLIISIAIWSGFIFLFYYILGTINL